MESNRQQNTGVNLYDRQDSHCITVIKKDFFFDCVSVPWKQLVYTDRKKAL